MSTKLSNIPSVGMRIPQSPPIYGDLINSTDGKRLLELISSGIGNQPQEKYLHWDKLRFRPPPDGFSTKEWWLATKIARASISHTLPFIDSVGNHFSYCEIGTLHRNLHQIDRDASGHIEVPVEDIANTGTRERYIVRSLVEEAITSSQLEGAATTREVAKEMLRSGRSPRDTSERMIVNNYRAMEFIREHKGEDLSIEMLLELQNILTEGTLDNPGAVGRFRNSSDEVHVVDNENQILHTPPDASELGQRINRLVAFANSSDDQHFIHPVVRATLLHFMIGYDHPFVDGNGRTARALFYWSMANSNYWLIEFISISSFIRKSPAAYARSYIYSETDGNDVTYFLEYNLRIIRRCIQELHLYLIRKIKERANLERLFLDGGLSYILNHRQKDLLVHMIKHPGSVYTIEGHRKSHGVSYHTARKDLDALAKWDFLSTTASGRKLLFKMNRDFDQNLREFAELLS